MQHGELRTDRCPWSIDKLFKLIFTHISYIFIAGRSDPTQQPASIRSKSMSKDVQGNLRHGPVKTENPNKNDDNEEVRGNLSHDLPEWLQEFRHGLRDESVPSHRDASSFSHELLSGPRAKVVSGKHKWLYSLPEGPTLRYLLENQNYKFSLQKTHWYSRA